MKGERKRAKRRDGGEKQERGREGGVLIVSPKNKV